MTMTNFRTRLLAVLLAAALCLSLLGCQAQEPDVAPETENLVKLCKVWGYTKYMHPAFLLGKKDWDEELLNLIPQVREMSTAEEVNELLHNWFVSLGEIDYESQASVSAWAAASEEEKIVVADTSWIEDQAYLGEALAADFALLPEELPNVYRRASPGGRQGAPVSFTLTHLPVFDDEPEHEGTYDDPNFRLLGLFRLWNIFEYYYPYLNMADRDWEELLVEHIPNMLEGTDQESYERTLWLLARETRDSHVSIVGMSSAATYWIPIHCIPAEGRPVVFYSAEDFPLVRGDVLLSVGGKSVDEIIYEKYGDHPRKEVTIHSKFAYGIYCEEEEVEIQILRGGEELTFSCKAVEPPNYGQMMELLGVLPAYELLENNVGYINIADIENTQCLEAIELFQDTQGLVIDLRMYPKENIYYLIPYVLGKSVHPFNAAFPSVAVPGAYLKKDGGEFGVVPGFSERYDKPVVILIGEGTASYGDTLTAVFRMAENTVLMGTNTDGSNGDVVYAPLPGDFWARFSSLGIYYFDDTQSQRTGVDPDIRVEPTIQGIADGRDEVLEAAIEYIKTGGAQ